MSDSRQSKPRGLLWLMFKLPVYIYRLRLGRLLGHRFLMLTHRGRKTGKIRHTVLEVIRYDKNTGESIVVAAYGENADWYRNIQANPAIELRIGRDRYAPLQRFLTPDEIYTEFSDYELRHPSAARNLPKLLGFKYDGSESGRRALAASFRIVSFCPKDRTAKL